MMKNLIHMMIYHEGIKYQPHVFIDEFCMNYKFQKAIESKCQKNGANETNHRFVYYSSYCYFLEINFKFQPEACKDCHGSMQKAVNFNYVTIVTVKENDHKIEFLYTSKDEAINVLRNVDLTEKGKTL